MRELRYSVAASLDGYIAGPNGEFDWIVVDPEIDFAAMYAGFSGLVMGRRSYDVFVSTGGGVGPALPTYVYSRTLPEGEREGVTFVQDAVAHLKGLKAGEGKPLWLWGGGDLFRLMLGRCEYLRSFGERKRRLGWSDVIVWVCRVAWKEIGLDGAGILRRSPRWLITVVACSCRSPARAC